MDLFHEGFENYNGSESLMVGGRWVSITAGLALSTTVARSGTWAFNVVGNNRFMRTVLRVPHATMGAGVAVYCPELPNADGYCNAIIFTGPGASRHISITINNDGSLSVYRGKTNVAFGTLLHRTVPGIIIPASWQQLEAKVLISSTVGTVEVKVENVQVINLTGQNTQSGTDTTIAQFWVGIDSGPNQNFYIDDVFVWNGDAPNDDFHGIRAVYYCYPTADTAEADWTPSSGSDEFAMIDEITPDDDTSYLTSTTPGDLSEHDVSNLPGAVQTVSSVIVHARAKKTDAGDVTLKIGVKSDASTDDSDEFAVTTAYVDYFYPIDLDPDGTVSWTPSAVNALKPRLQRIT